MRLRPAIEALRPYEPGRRIAGGIKLSSNENPRGASPMALASMRDAAGELNRYPDGGIHELREALARKWDVDPSMVVVGNGSDEIMVMIAGAFMEPGDNLITGAHTFSQYEFAGTLFGGEIRKSPMPEGRFDVRDIAGRVDERTRVVFVCSPNNPTGTIIPGAELQWLLDNVPEDVVVAVDEAYGEYADDPDYPDTVAIVRERPNVIRLRTFSKIYGLAALRVGYAIAQQDLAGAVLRLRQPFNVGTIAQVAATAALSDHEFVNDSIRENREGRNQLEALLDERSIPRFPSQANFVTGDFSRAGGGTQSVLEKLRSAGITVRPLASFGMPNYLRISVGTDEEMDQLYSALAPVLASA